MVLPSNSITKLEPSENHSNALHTSSAVNSFPRCPPSPSRPPLLSAPISPPSPCFPHSSSTFFVHPVYQNRLFFDPRSKTRAVELISLSPPCIFLVCVPVPSSM